MRDRAGPMEWLNYHHLLYFWTVVREGGVVRAAEKLRLKNARAGGMAVCHQTVTDGATKDRPESRAVQKYFVVSVG